MRVLTITLLAALAVVPAHAAERPFTVRDEGGFFSPGAVEKANAVIARIARDYDKDLLIETFREPPPDRQRELEGSGKEAMFESWAAARYRSQGVRGISLLINRRPGYVQAEVGAQTRAGAFTLANRKQLVATLLARFQKKEYDEGLLEAVDYVASRLQQFKASGVSTRQERFSGGQAAPRSRSWLPGGLMGWVCIGLVALLGIWLIFGLIRGVSGGGGGGYGPASGSGYGSGYGGGGGGFFPSLLGGMFGAAAGMWIYDSVFRGSSTPSTFGDTTQPAAFPPDDTNPAGTGGSFDSGDDGSAGGSFGDDGGGDIDGGGGGSFDDGDGGSFGDDGGSFEDGGGGGFDDGGGFDGGYDGGGGDF